MNGAFKSCNDIVYNAIQAVCKLLIAVFVSLCLLQHSLYSICHKWKEDNESFKRGESNLSIVSHTDIIWLSTPRNDSLVGNGLVFQPQLHARSPHSILFQIQIVDSINLVVVVVVVWWCVVCPLSLLAAL
jgi:hypothetical protein